MRRSEAFRNRVAAHAYEPLIGVDVGLGPLLRPARLSFKGLVLIREPGRNSLTGPGVGEVTSRRAAPDPPRLALSRRDAASALGMSLRHFQRHVQPNLRWVYSGQLRLYPVAELERWIKEQGWRNDAGP